jgi:threonine/homoserine/homoserine lactone efflux protein
LFEGLGVLYRGMVLGVMIAAPVGPVGLLCIRRTLQKGFLRGFATGFGAAFADAFFSAVAAFGVAAILSLIQTYNATIHILGGLFLLGVAWHTWHDAPRQPDEDKNGAKAAGPLGALAAVARAMTSGFLLILTNPVALFGTLAVVATFGSLQNRMDAYTMVAGVFIGSSLWWLLLSGGTSLVRRHFTERGVVWINRGTAIALSPLALWAIASGALVYMGVSTPF